MTDALVMIMVAGILMGVIGLAVQLWALGDPEQRWRACLKAGMMAFGGMIIFVVASNVLFWHLYTVYH